MLKKFFVLALMLVTSFISPTVFALSIYYPADGIYSIQPKFAPDKELSVQNHANNWGANVIIDSLNSGWQKWKIQRIPGTHFYSIVAVSSNLAIDVANAQASDGANIATWPFLEGRQNQFAFFDAGGGYYAIKVNLDGNFVLDVERAENRAGANVLSWNFGGSDNQLWRLVMIKRLPEFQSYNKRAMRKVTAYVMPDLQSRSGNEWVDAGDNVTVLREEGNAYLVRYPVSGGTKTRWVNKNEIFSGSTTNSGNVSVNHNPQGNVQIAESTQPNTLHVKGTAFDQDNPSGSTRLHVYVGGTPGSNVPQYEIRTNGSNRVFDDTRKIDSNYSGNQLVHIYALNDYGSGENIEIWKGYVNIQSNNPSPSINLKVPLLKQNYRDWANKKINTDTIGNIGCTVTSLAMKYNYHNNTNITPVDVVNKLKANGGFSGNAIVYDNVKRAFGYKNDIVSNKPSLNNTWMKKIYDQLKIGNPVIIGAYKTSEWQHWVIVKGYTGNSTTNFNAADFLINDPQNDFSNLQQFINRYSMGLRGIIY